MSVNQSMLMHPSRVHGAGHINRVIYLALMLCRNSGFDYLFPEAFAAAHLHDLARTHDGTCTEHGMRAVQAMMGRYMPLYMRAGVSPSRVSHIATAVVTHCIDEEIPEGHPAHILSNILKDADALDRCRLGDHQLDRSRLRLIRSPFYIDRAKELFQATNHDSSLEEVWSAASKIFMPDPKILETIKTNYDDAETGIERRDRRLKQGAQYWRYKLNTAYFDPKVSLQEAVWRLLADLAKMDQRMFDIQVAPTIPHLRSLVEYVSKFASEMVPLTFLRTPALNSFQREGLYKSFFEVGDVWHSTYHDRPDVCRASIDDKLFGEQGRWVTYGAFVHPQDHNSFRSFQHFYGDHCIQWNESVMECASFCVNDSHSNCSLLPFSRENLAKVLLSVTQGQGFPYLRVFNPWNAIWENRFDFIEFQIHRKLTIADVNTWQIAEKETAKAS